MFDSITGIGWLYQIFWFVFIIKYPAYWLCQNPVYRLCSDLIWWLLNWYLWRWSDYIGNNSYMCLTEWYQSDVVILISQLRLNSLVDYLKHNTGRLWLDYMDTVMYEIINAFYIDNDMNHMIMMVCISYNFVFYWWHSWNLLIEIWFDF